MLPIYSLGNKTKLKQLRTIQDWCAKALYRLHRRTSSTYLYSSSILPFEQLAMVERVTHLHKMLKTLTRHNLKGWVRATSVTQTINDYNRIRLEMSVTVMSSIQFQEEHCTVEKHNRLIQTIPHNRLIAGTSGGSCHSISHDLNLTRLKSFSSWMRSAIFIYWERWNINQSDYEKIG